jgi:pimeloyl-ACP methyl ester carboxylesterase
MNRLPVLLIHGYFEDASVWNTWVHLLQNDGIPGNWIFPVTFHSGVGCDGLVGMTCDQCGSAAQHAQELVQIVQNVKSQTGADKVNLVGHSKGGLDARLYLGNNLSNSEVANLIMIGTPNNGSAYADPQSDPDDPCTPAVSDIRVGAADTMASRNPNTQYYTIAGDWNPSLPCSWGFPDSEGFYFYFPEANDGLVNVSSVESQPYFINLGHTPNCHQDLTGNQTYLLARDVLLGSQGIANKMTSVRPNITGSLSTRNMTAKDIRSQVHVSLANASNIAEKTVGPNSHAVSVRLEAVSGFVVYIAVVLDVNHGTHNVLVDAGNEKVLSSTQVSIATMMMRRNVS